MINFVHEGREGNSETALVENHIGFLDNSQFKKNHLSIDNMVGRVEHVLTRFMYDVQ